MKYRTDFVTNSSSSSFVIAIKNENDKLPTDIEEILLEWAKNQILKGEKISTIEELNEYFCEEYSWKHMTLEELLNDDIFASEDYENYKKLIEEGFCIYKKWIPCEGQDEHLDMYEEALDLLEESKNYKGLEIDLDY